jgi:hypothetical protein
MRTSFPLIAGSKATSWRRIQSAHIGKRRLREVGWSTK